MSDDFRDTIDGPGRLGLLSGTGVVFSDGVIEEEGDVDVFALELQAGSVYRFAQLGWWSDVGDLDDPALELYNSNGQLVAADDISGRGLEAYFVYSPSESGTYFLHAGAYPGSSPLGSYVVGFAERGSAFGVLVDDIAGNAPAPSDLSGIRDFDGNDLGAADGWKLIGEADVDLDFWGEHIYVNPEIGRWATVGTFADGTADFDDHGESGITRVVGIYIDPLVASGEVERFSDFDSQQRFQNDLFIDNLTVVDAFDFDADGFQEVYFKVNDGTAYLRALMHDDGNIQYANYQSAEQVTDYLTSLGYGAEVIDSILV